jgi:hypothetical protein
MDGWSSAPDARAAAFFTVHIRGKSSFVVVVCA